MTGLVWAPSPWDSCVDEVLSSWEGTKYVANQCVKGRGVDCVRFLIAVLDELYGFKRAHYSELPHDAALHQPDLARSAMRKLFRMYAPNTPWDGDHIESGDIFVVSFPGGGPGHAIIASSKQSVLYHAGHKQVTKTGLHFFGPFEVYRILDKHRWLKV